MGHPETFKTKGDASKSTPVTVRLPEQDISDLKGLAIVDGDNLATQLRKACDIYVERRLSSPTIPAEIGVAKARVNALLDSLL